MKFFNAALLVFAFTPCALAGPFFESPFEEPRQLVAGGKPVSVGKPGYACPSVADVDGDGRADLVVGQFADGAMKFYRNTAEPGKEPVLAEGQWITAGGKAAEVPGVW